MYATREGISASSGREKESLTRHPDVFEATVVSLPTSAAGVEVVTYRLVILCLCTKQTTISGRVMEYIVPGSRNQNDSYFGVSFSQVTDNQCVTKICRSIWVRSQTTYA